MTLPVQLGSAFAGSTPGVSVCPDVVCYLTLPGATQHASRFPRLFGKPGGINAICQER
jgi:hypothetical protein